MTPKTLITAVLIAYRNEEFTIGKVIDNLVRKMPDAEIYLFDNNSSYRVSKIPREKKAGKGTCDGLHVQKSGDGPLRFGGWRIHLSGGIDSCTDVQQLLEKRRFECYSSFLPTRIKVVQTYSQSFGQYNHCGTNAF